MALWSVAVSRERRTTQRSQKANGRGGGIIISGIGGAGIGSRCSGLSIYGLVIY